MKNLLLSMLVLTSFLFAAEPPDFGRVITTQMVDATTVVQFHERGVSIVQLDLQTLKTTTSYAENAPPSFTTTWKDTSGATQSVTTCASGSSDQAVLTAINSHKRSVALMQAAFPPAPQP